MKQKIKITLLIIFIVIFVFPTVALAGSITFSLINGKSVKEAIQTLAGQIDFLVGRVGIVENCQKVQEIRTQAEQAYSHGSHQLITGGTIDQYISITQGMLQEYQALAEDYNLLCPPTAEGIRIYCTTRNDHLSYHNHNYDFSLPQNIRGKNSNSLIIACDLNSTDPSQNWQNKIDKTVQGLKDGPSSCKLLPDFGKEAETQKIKLEQLQKLNTEYLLLKDRCGV
jgi:hypothetical protein